VVFAVFRGVGHFLCVGIVGDGTMSQANDRQEGGSHYKTKAIQPWDYIVANDLGFLEGSIIKYVTRYKEKNGVNDLKKAAHFLEKLIEVQSGKN
jgi:hypothetical protein